MRGFKAARWRTTSNPATMALPAEGGSRPHSMRMVVVLPEPLGPRKPKMSPRRTSKLTWSTATKEPKRRARPSAWTARSSDGTSEVSLDWGSLGSWGSGTKDWPGALAAFRSSMAATKTSSKLGVVVLKSVMSTPVLASCVGRFPAGSCPSRSNRCNRSPNAWTCVTPGMSRSRDMARACGLAIISTAVPVSVFLRAAGVSLAMICPSRINPTR